MRIGLLGASAIAPNAVIRPAAKRADVTVTAVAAREIERARDYAARNGIAGVAESYAELVERDDIDLVYCALPPSLHAEWCAAALTAGKMVLLEKPYAMDEADARRIVAMGGVVIEAFHYRFHSQFERACDLVASGAIGDVIGASAAFDTPIREDDPIRWNPACGGGGMMDLGCYTVHALRTLLRVEPKVVGAAAEFRSGVDAELTATLRFGDVSASIRCSMLGGDAQFVTLEGSAGRLMLDRFVAPHEGGSLTLDTPADRTVEPATGPTTYDAQLDHVVRVFRGEEAPRTGGGDAIANMAVIDAVLATARG